MSTPPDSSYHEDWYPSWPSFGKKLNLQWSEIRQDTSALQGLMDAVIYDKDPDSIKDHVFQGIEYGSRGTRHNNFRTIYDDITDEWKVQVNVGSEAFPVWDNSLTINTSGEIDSFYLTNVNIFVKDTNIASYRTDTIIFNRDNFYITSNSEGKPIINALAQATAGTPGTGTITGGTNLGAGTGEVFKDASGANLRFRTLLQGSGVSISTGTNEVTIASTVTGESTTASNVGSGDGQVFKTLSGTDLQFRRLAGAGTVSISTGTNDVTITGSAGATDTLQTAYTAGDGKITGVTTAKPVSIEGSSGTQRVLQASGRVSFAASTSEFGTESKTVNGATRPHQVFIHGSDEFSLGMDIHSDSGVAGPGLRLYRSGGTAAAETVPPDDAVVGALTGYTHDGTDYGQTGRLRILLKGEADNNNTPGIIHFDTVSTGQSTYSGSTNSGNRGTISEDGWDIKGNAKVRDHFYVLRDAFIRGNMVVDGNLDVTSGILTVYSNPGVDEQDDATLRLHSTAAGAPQIEFVRAGQSNWFFGSSEAANSSFFIFETPSGNTPILIRQAATGKDTTTLVTDSTGAIGIGTFAATNPAFKVTLAGVSRSLSDFYVGSELFVHDRARVAKASRTTLRRENSESSYTPNAHDRNVFALNLNQSAVSINNPINLPGTDETMTLTFLLKPRSSTNPVVSWGTRYLFPSNATPTITTIGNRTDVINGIYDGGFYILCSSAQNYLTS